MYQKEKIELNEQSKEEGQLTKFGKKGGMPDRVFETLNEVDHSKYHARARLGFAKSI